MAAEAPLGAGVTTIAPPAFLLDVGLVPIDVPNCIDVAWFLPPCTSAPADDKSSLTTKLVPESVSTEVVSSVVLPDAILIACDCHAESLMGPVTPLIVADAFVNVTAPKLAKDEMLPPTLGASTIHSADDRSASGLCNCDELS